MRFSRRTSSGEDVAPTAVEAAGSQAPPAAASSPLPAAEDPAFSLTSDMVRGVRFNISSPQGYFFPQVETFVQQVADVLRAHEQRDYDNRSALDSAETELALALSHAARLRTEIELFTVQGAPLTNPDGSYVTESQHAAQHAAVGAEPDASAAPADPAVLAQVAEQQEVIVALEATIAARDEEVARLDALLHQSEIAQQTMQQHLEAVTDHSEAQARYAEELRAWGEQVAANLAQVSEDLASTQQALSEATGPQALARTASPLPATATSPDAATAPDPAVPLEAEATQVQAEVAEQVMPWDQPTSAPATHTDLPQPVTHVAESPSGPASPHQHPSASAAVDSELPPGVVLPRRASDQEYFPAAPGMPLSTGGLPAHLWAPELADQANPTRDPASPRD